MGEHADDVVSFFGSVQQRKYNVLVSLFSCVLVVGNTYDDSMRTSCLFKIIRRKIHINITYYVNLLRTNTADVVHIDMKKKKNRTHVARDQYVITISFIIIIRVRDADVIV